MEALERLLSATYEEHLYVGSLYEETDCESRATWVWTAELKDELKRREIMES